MFKSQLRHLYAASIALALSGIGQIALADMPVVYKDGNKALFSLSVPDFWTVRAGGARELAPPGSDEVRPVSRVMGMQPVSEDRVWVGFQSPAGLRNISDGEEYLRNVGPFLVRDPEVAGSKTMRIGGRPARVVNGTGRLKSKKVSFTAVVIDLPGNRVAISVTVFESGVDPEFVNDVNAIFGSFRALQ